METQLGDHRVRVTQHEAGPRCRVEILDIEGNVVADISNSVGSVEWDAGIQSGLAMVKIGVPSERVTVESLDLQAIVGPAHKVPYAS